MTDTDRGIGGTGLVGVITGFASVCMDGVEVDYNADTALASDTGATLAFTALRAGQLAVVQAYPTGDGLIAQNLALRHEVIGPVDSVTPGGLLTVAGQIVRRTPATRGLPMVTAGDWVAVSGLRDGAGQIAASRIDPSPRGRVSLHGRLSHAGDRLLVGALALHVRRGTVLPPDGAAVAVAGRYLDGVLYVSSLLADPLADDPSAVFVPGTTEFYVESWVALRVGGEFDASVFGRGPVIVQLRRSPDGKLHDVSAVPSGYAAQTARRLGSLHPTPSLNTRRRRSGERWHGSFSAP